MPEDPDHLPKHALPLAEALDKLRPEWEKRFPWHAPRPIDQDPAEKYFSNTSYRPLSPEESFYAAAELGIVETWGRPTPGADLRPVQPALWRMLVIGDFELGLASNEVPERLIEFWDIRVALAPRRGRPSLGDDDAPLVEEMRRMILADPKLSVWAATDVVVDRAPGGGTRDSRRKRLLDGYLRKFPRD